MQPPGATGQTKPNQPAKPKETNEILIHGIELSEQCLWRQVDLGLFLWGFFSVVLGFFFWFVFFFLSYLADVSF